MNEDKLFERYASASMELGDRETLKELLKTDPQAGKRFASFMGETSLYVSIAEEMDIKDSAVKIREAKQSSKMDSLKEGRERLKKQNESIRRKTKVRVLLSIAALLTIGCFLFLQNLKDSKTVGFVDAATVSLERGGYDYTWGNQSELLDGDSLTALQDSSIHLKDGSLVYLKKGAVCKVQNTKNGLLVEQLSGRARYNVAKQQKGSNFRVMTDKLRTTVIGTVFTVDAEASLSKVRVMEGLVKVDDMINVSYFVNPGEFAVLEKDEALSKKAAHKSMQLSGLLTDSSEKDFSVERIEEKKYMLLLYAAKWDPSSRVFIHKMKEYYSKNQEDYEVIFMNDKESFAAEFEMPWPKVKEGSLDKADKAVGGFSKSSYPLNLVLIDQHGNIISRSVKGSEWLGAEHVLDALEENL